MIEKLKGLFATKLMLIDPQGGGLCWCMLLDTRLPFQLMPLLRRTNW